MGDYLSDEDEGDFADWLIGMEDTPGFGNCNECKYFRAGSPTICSTCASQTLKTPQHPCPVCGQDLKSSAASCTNRLCVAPNRQFDRIHAIGMKTGALQRAILAYKDDQRWGWGVIFGRVLLGFLRANPALAQKFDMIIPMPAFLGPDQTRQMHDLAAWMIESAIKEDEDDLPFLLAPRVIVKRYATPKMRTTAGVAERRRLALQIRAALDVPEPALVAGQKIAVVDDVFTGGHTLNVVAEALREGGARSVSGIVIARQPWRT